MKYLLKIIVLVIVWPLALVVFALPCIIWLCRHCLESERDIELEDSIAQMAYFLWHFKCRPKG